MKESGAAAASIRAGDYDGVWRQKRIRRGWGRASVVGPVRLTRGRVQPCPPSPGPVYKPVRSWRPFVSKRL
jgi:hypothetical protein